MYTAVQLDQLIDFGQKVDLSCKIAIEVSSLCVALNKVPGMFLHKDQQRVKLT